MKRKLVSILLRITKFLKATSWKFRILLASCVVILSIVFILLAIRVQTALVLIDANPVMVSDAYYANLPVNDPLQINFSGPIPSYIDWKYLVDTDQGIPLKLQYNKSSRRLSVSPANGTWNRSTKITIRIKRPDTITYNSLSFIKQIVRPGNKGILKEISFTTAGKFTVINSINSYGSIDPKTGILLTFNYRLKDPQKLKDFVIIDPPAPFTITPVIKYHPVESGMSYTISSSELQYKKTYTITVKPGVVSDLNEKLIEPFRLTFKTMSNPDFPSLSFGDRGKDARLIVINPGYSQQIPVIAEKTSTFKLNIYDITPAEVINYLIYKQDADENYWNRESEYKIVTKNKPVRWQKEVLSSDIGSNLRYPDLPVGVYILEAVATGAESDVIAQTIVNVTTLGAVTNIGMKDMLFFVSQINTGESVNNADIRVYTLKNEARIIATGRTEESGLARIPNPGVGDLAVVFSGSDTGFIPLSVPGSQMTRSGVRYGWEDYYSNMYPVPAKDDIYSSYIYTDRPIYKPGDKVQTKALIRIDNDGQYVLPGTAKFTVNLTRQLDYWGGEPEKPMVSKEVLANEFGTTWSELKLPVEMKAGKYYAVLKLGDKELASQGFIVSDYKKPLYHLEVSSDKENVYIGDTIKYKIKASYSFGAPAKDKVVSWTLYENPYWNDNNTEDDYAVNNWKRDSLYQYWWDYYSEYYNQNIAGGTVTINADGEGFVEIPVKNKIQDTGKRKILTLVAEISDESSVPETASKKIYYSESSYRLEFIKINNRTGSAFITTQVFDGKNKPVSNIPVSMTKSNKYLDTKNTNSDGKITWKISDDSSKDLKFTWKDSSGREESRSFTFYIYNPMSESKNDQLQIKRKNAVIDMPANPDYGTTVDFSVSGGGKKHLVVFERASVVDAFVIGDHEKMPIEINDKFMPNVYISTYSFVNGAFVTGYSDVSPQNLEDYRRINITISPDKMKYNPGDTALLSVKTTDVSGNPVSAEVSLAVVDKSIYDLKKQSKFPVHPYFYHLRSDMTVYSENLSGLWIYSYGGRGGGGGGGGNSVREIFADTAFYQPNIITDEKGTATVSFTLPDNLTTWVTSALAVSKRFDVGENQSEFTVSKDIFAIPVFPAFITEGDKLSFSALVGNFGDSSQKLNVSFAFDNIAPPKNPTQSINIDSDKTSLLSWNMTFGNNIGSKEAVILVTKGPNEIADQLKIQVPVVPKGVTVKTRSSGIGSSKIVPKLINGADKNKSQTSLYMTSGILGYISDLLFYQAGYPYGCVEQTMSKLYPTLLVKKYKDALEYDETKLPPDLDKMIDAGIARLSKFQHEDGGWGLWEDDTSSVFNTSYVLSGLYDLSFVYAIPPGMIDKAVKYLEKLESNGSMSKSEKTAALLPLARFKSPAATKIAASFSEIKDLDDQELSQIAIALSVLNDSKANQAIDELIKRAEHVDTTQIRWKTGNNSKYHPHENLTIALAIQALLASRPDHPFIPLALNYLNNHKNANVYGSTYTNSQVTKAFVEYTLKNGKTSLNITVLVKQNGQTLGTYNFTKNNQIEGPVKVTTGSELEIETAGNGTILWEVRTENVFSGDVKAYNTDKFSISRTYRNLTGSDNTIKVGDIIAVSLTVTARGTSDLSDLVVSDPLPAGLQPIDTTLDNENNNYADSNTDWMSKEIYADHVVLFPYYLSSNGSSTYTYKTRAYIPGTFSSGPATVSLMYDPAAPAYTDTNKIQILSN